MARMPWARMPSCDQAAAVRLRRWRWAALIVFAVWLNLGCNPITVTNLLLTPFVDDKTPPKCKLAAKDKPVTVALMVTHANPDFSSPETLPVEFELAERLTQAMRKRFAENKEKVTILPPAKVKSYQNKFAGKTLLAHELGQHFHADYVIQLEINNISLYEKRSQKMFYRGNAEIAISVLDVSKPRGEGTIFSEEFYQCEYPRERPLEVGDSSVAQFRALFLTRIARDLTRFFAASPAEERFTMD